jgi:hypothetical protein
LFSSIPTELKLHEIPNGQQYIADFGCASSIPTELKSPQPGVVPTPGGTTLGGMTMRRNPEWVASKSGNVDAGLNQPFQDSTRGDHALMNKCQSEPHIGCYN